uniref:Uncharacterized protein n=1 Tax=Arundo donax TaxID=35708 RepID=A0A0A9GLI9_ARUDO
MWLLSQEESLSLRVSLSLYKCSLVVSMKQFFHAWKEVEASLKMIAFFCFQIFQAAIAKIFMKNWCVQSLLAF